MLDYLSNSEAVYWSSCGIISHNFNVDASFRRCPLRAMLHFEFVYNVYIHSSKFFYLGNYLKSPRSRSFARALAPHLGQCKSLYFIGNCHICGSFLWFLCGNQTRNTKYKLKHFFFVPRQLQ